MQLDEKISVNNYSCKPPDVTDSTNHFSHSVLSGSFTDIGHTNWSNGMQNYNMKKMTYRFMQEWWLKNALHQYRKKLKIAAVVAVTGMLFSLVCVEDMLSDFYHVNCLCVVLLLLLLTEDQSLNLTVIKACFKKSLTKLVDLHFLI